LLQGVKVFPQWHNLCIYEFENLSESRLIYCVFTGIFHSACRRHVLRICLRCRTVCKTIIPIGRPRRRRRPQQAWPVRVSLPVRPVRRITIRGLTVRGHTIRCFSVRSITIRRLAVRRLPVRSRTIRRFSSPVRRRVVLRYLPVRRQDFRFTVRLLPMREDMTAAPPCTSIYTIIPIPELPRQEMPLIYSYAQMIP